MNHHLSGFSREPGRKYRQLTVAERPVRRFPPVLQFLTRSSPLIERTIRMRALECFRHGASVERICGEIYRTALDEGFLATIGVQEVTSRSMPSFPGEEILSALLIIDLQFDPELAVTPRISTGRSTG